MLAVAVIMYIWLLCIWTFIPQTSGVSAMNRKGCLFSPLVNDLRRSYSSRNHGDGTRQTARNGFTPQFIAADDVSHVQLFATPWTAAHQAPLSMGFPIQETRVATREESGVLGFPSRRGLTPRGSLACGAREVRSPCAWRGGARPGSRVTGGD